MSVCPFANAVAITTETPTITAVKVTPETPTVNKGTSIQFTATVTGTGLFPQNVTWVVMGNSDPATTITPMGLFTMGANETGTVQVKATSVFDTNKNDSTAVTVGS